MEERVKCDEQDITAKIKWADANALANIATGIVILSLWGLLLQRVDGVAVIMALPWILVATPIVLIAVVVLFRNGDIVGATANAILTGITLCQMGIRGLIVLAFVLSGKQMPPAAVTGMGMIDGAAYLAAAVMLICVVFICFRVGNRTNGFFVLFPTVGFFSFGISNLGIANLSMLGGVLIVCFGGWLIYSGCGMMLEQVFGKKILPY